MATPKKEPLTRKFVIQTKTEFFPISEEDRVSNNPEITGDGIWSVIIQEPSNHRFRKIFLSEEIRRTNAHALDLTAAIQAIAKIPRNPDGIASEIDFFTKSHNLREGATKWIHNWKKNHWRTSKNNPIQNVSLWIKLSVSVENRKISWLKSEEAQDSEILEKAISRNLGVIQPRISRSLNGSSLENNLKINHLAHEIESRDIWVEKYRQGNSIDIIAKQESVSKKLIFDELKFREISLRRYNDISGKQAYESRRNKSLSWIEIGRQITSIPEEFHTEKKLAKVSFENARIYAEKHGMEWPIVKKQ